MRVLDDQDYKDYRIKVTEVYAEQMRALIGYQADLAKWIFATLILINSGALAGIVSSSRIVDGAARIGAPWFIAGIGTALASGFISWLNTTIAIGIYGKIVSPAAIFDRASQPEFKKNRTL
ncbi:hypothetical protein [Polymorphobacter megasporae]|uniref:hypothetical protein n=1 Tax=Glacieibacterium megasporae TaxID=2835787 RepID=UPI001C1E4C76|nr:hypothetical protein [Polymorphobacter megasporae]UAJ12266.1 hypothetical protein KTC28_20775 [Polymorphobacter megasporae]